MKSKFIVISKSGNIFDASSFLEKKEISENFKILIKREALGEDVKENIENEKPEYIKYAHKYGFSWEKNADIGFISMDYKANFMHRLVKEYARKVVHQIGLPIMEVSGSRMFDMSHPVVKAYSHLYGERLFQPSIGEKEMVMGYDCSYPQFNLAEKYQISYKQIPFAHFSINECYRLEQSGECMLLYRGRQFNMPDLHPYFKDVSEAFAWFPKIENQIAKVMNDARRDYIVSIAVSSENYWNKYKNEIIKIAKNNDRDVLVEIPEEDKNAYWIINVDYKIIDALGQSREIACIQIDVENAKRLGISYIDENGKKQSPIIIHSAVSGGIERYLYMIFDNYKNYFPIWLQPVQIRLIPVSDKYIDKCIQIAERYKDEVRIDIDDRAESVSKRIKLAKQDNIPYQVVIGEKESQAPENLKDLNQIIKQIKNEQKKMPFIPIDWPIFASMQVK